MRLHLAYARGIFLPTIRRFVETGLSGPIERMEGPLCFPGIYHAHGEGLTAAVQFFATGTIKWAGLYGIVAIKLGKWNISGRTIKRARDQWRVALA